MEFKYVVEMKKYLFENHEYETGEDYLIFRSVNKKKFKNRIADKSKSFCYRECICRAMTEKVNGHFEEELDILTTIEEENYYNYVKKYNFYYTPKDESDIIFKISLSDFGSGNKLYVKFYEYNKAMKSLAFISFSLNPRSYQDEVLRVIKKLAKIVLEEPENRLLYQTGELVFSTEGLI
jgi:hypothetical protein